MRQIHFFMTAMAETGYDKSVTLVKIDDYHAAVTEIHGHIFGVFGRKALHLAESLGYNLYIDYDDQFMTITMHVYAY